METTAVVYASVSSTTDRQDTSRQIRDLEILAGYFKANQGLGNIGENEIPENRENIRGTYIRRKENTGKANPERLSVVLLQE